MARRTKAEIIKSARKGAKTKRKKAELQRQIQIASMANAGLSAQEIALAIGEDIDAVIKTLRLLTFAPHPLAKAVGIGATVVDTVGDLVKQVGRRSPDQLSRDIESFPKALDSVVKRVNTALKETDKVVASGSRAAEPVANIVEQLGRAIRETAEVLGQSFVSPEEARRRNAAAKGRLMS